MSVPGEAAGPSRLTRLGRYELITRIGEGGMAEVQLALQRGPAGFEKLVVVKLVHDNLASQKAFVDMLLDEARVAALVKHPNVVDIYDLGQAEGRYFIAMEYLEGEPLLAVLRAGREGKRLDPLSTGRLIADTAEGLDAAHELRTMSGERLELVHHDISLGNIVVLYNGQVKLVDFGVAKASQSATKGAKVQGKFSYMAPEKLRGSPGDRRSDIFSLGCVTWEALTLKRLFRGGNDSETMRQVLELSIQPPSSVNSEVPPEYDAIVMRALDRDPEKRHATAKELAVEIEELLRQRGYGAKNDRVAKYMQETFRAHIDARKKLVQEVVSKGSASAEVLDAAFSDPAMASGSPVRPATNAGDFSLAYRRVTPSAGIPVTGAPLADVSKPHESSGPIPEGTPARANEPSGAAPASEPSSGVVAPAAPPVAVSTPTRVPYRLVTDTPIAGTEGNGGLIRGLLRDPQKRMFAAIVGGLLLLVIVLIVATRGGAPDETRHEAATVGSGSEREAPAIGSGSAVVVPDAAIVVEVPPADAAVHAEPPDAQVVVVRPKAGVVAANNDTSEKRAEAAALFKQSLQQFVRGDAKGALAGLQKARAANPSFAPTWRLMGQIYEKLGERGSSKNAYLRYLSLAPNAPDAPAIRERLKQL